MKKDCYVILVDYDSLAIESSWIKKAFYLDVNVLVAFAILSFNTKIFAIEILIEHITLIDIIVYDISKARNPFIAIAEVYSLLWQISRK